MSRKSSASFVSRSRPIVDEPSELGGWSYDVDPNQGKPTKVILCDKSCDVVRADAMGQVDIVQGCKSIIL